MIQEEIRIKNESAIREMVDGFVQAVCSKDIKGVMAAYAPELVAFDVVPPLQYVGAEEFIRPWKEVFELYDEIHYEVHGLNITAGDDIAFSHSLNRMRGTTTSGAQTDIWLRWTVCYRKIDERWSIVHLQISVPVNLKNGKTMLDLKPQTER